MTGPNLDQVEQVASQIVDAIAEEAPSSHAIWQIAGRPTVGKSSALEAIARRLTANAHLIPVKVNPAARYLDAGPVALADIAVGLATANLLNGEFESWKRDRLPWHERAQVVQSWLNDHRDRVVLLCDEPAVWGASRHEGDIFRTRGEEVAALLTSGQTECRRVVTGSLPGLTQPLARYELGSPDVDIAWLSDAEEWGELAGSAADLADSDITDQPLSPLEVRLLVALVALRDVEFARRVVGEGEGRRFISQRLSELVASDPAHHGLWKTWLALSLARRSFAPALTDRLADPKLQARDRAVLMHCLLFGDRELRLHDVLRAQAARWREALTNETTAVVRNATRQLFEYHRERFEHALQANQPAAVTESMEAFHFATSAGDSELLSQVQPYFAEQLDALGWSLSYEHRRFADAVKAFEAAVKWDEQDDYAHHYVAFNLDRLGQEPDRVESEYGAALRLNPEHGWWHARLINFLISRGRVPEARLRWLEALDVLEVGEGDTDATTYETLHCWVGAALLDAGELGFAADVLDEVPHSARLDIPTYQQLRSRLEALRQARELGALVPAHRLTGAWWTTGPELLQARLGDGRELMRWLAARVELHDEDGLHIRVAQIQRHQTDAPEVFHTTISDDVFDQMCRDDVKPRELEPGRHLEIGLYANESGGDEETLLRVLEPRPWPVPNIASFRVGRWLTSPGVE